MVILMYNPQLETFLCVAEAGSFNRAAERLYISPPAVIKQINLLENPCIRIRNISSSIVRIP